MGPGYNASHNGGKSKILPGTPDLASYICGLKARNTMARILTGIQSSGIPHLGNALGAIEPGIELSQKAGNESFFFIADLHSLTSVKDADKRKESVYAVAAAWLALGFDVENNYFYRQSDIPEVTELTWYLSCFTPYPMLANAHSFKDKSDRLSDVNAGLFTYPVLMASDILLYDATHVPVGEDQKQHLELSRDIANKFNLDFNSPDFLIAPDPLIQKNFARIMSLKDGNKKMSKSDPSELSRINLNDSKDEIFNKIKKAKTDTEPLPENAKQLAARPEAENLLGIYSSLSDQSLIETINEFSGKNFSEFKEKLTNLVIDKIAPISHEINKLLKDNKFIDDVLNEGAQKANEIASKKIKNIKKIIGF